MEKNILNLIQFDLYSPTTVHFLKVLFQVLDVSLNQRTRILSSYLADLMLLPFSSLQFKPSLLASSIIFVALASENQRFSDKGGAVEAELNNMKAIYSQWYTFEDFKRCIEFVVHSWNESK